MSGTLISRVRSLWNRTVRPSWNYLPLRDLSASNRITNSPSSRPDTNPPSDLPSEAQDPSIMTDMEANLWASSEALGSAQATSAPLQESPSSLSGTATRTITPSESEPGSTAGPRSSNPHSVIHIDTDFSLAATLRNRRSSARRPYSRRPPLWCETRTCLIIKAISVGVGILTVWELFRRGVECYDKTCGENCPSFLLKDKGRGCSSNKRGDLFELAVSANYPTTSLPIAITDPLPPSSSTFSPAGTLDGPAFTEMIDDGDEDDHGDNDDEDGGTTLWLTKGLD
ncbi:hypothetical protein BCR39DRAFT_575008 [Naematelia encephala]|uniref:Uncharacterized protein n=1 Tax=Naematelia encephala TaxID=71784 RepID=A0A1Y2B3R5_9TREE|nr:hypothetical protein BCR39DRAFT_575008 [Naematelia encephala]